MGNSDKRAKRAKLKAKSENIQRQRKTSKTPSSYELAPEVVALFEKMPSPLEEQICLRQIYKHIEEDSEVDFEDPEATAMVLFAMYKEWHSQKSR
ncbi:hypothetical protein [Stutzerimonas nitrititolerans]|uniref:hypothetical protein n=1 Tax=Stutzerimonas nitrititolerans TaxID=2482751 RepID=UPI0028B0A1AC|nr:hypothetical protein [Stutzerimonas nitrititolerans]